MVISIILAILFIVIALVLLMGKGDWLIAGYNTASEEERKRVNIRRLRLLTAIMMLITAVYCISLPAIGQDADLQLSASGVFLVITFAFVILANTWAKKK